MSDAIPDQGNVAAPFSWQASEPAPLPKARRALSDAVKSGSPILILLGGLIALFIAIALVAAALGPDTYSGVDGKFNQTIITTYLSFGRPFVVNTVNPLEGVFSQLFPINIWLNPGFVQFLILDHDVALLVSTAIFLLIYAVAIYILARTVGASLGVAIVSAQLGAFVFPPLYHWAGLFSNFDLMPGAALTVALFTLLLSVILRLQRLWRSFMIGFVLSTALIAYIALIDPLTMGVMGFSFLIPFVVAILEGRRVAVIGLRLLVLGGAAVTCYAAGLVDFILAMDHYTARFYFRQEFFRPQTTDFVSVLFDYPEAARTYAFLVPGWLLGLLLCRGRQRLIPAMAGLNFLWLIVYGSLYLFTSFHWLAPLPIYVEEYTIHIAGLGAVIGWAALLQWIFTFGWRTSMRRVDYQLSSSFSAAAAALIVPVLVAFYALRIPASDHGMYHEPWVDEPELVTYLRDQIGLHDGAEFRGTAYVFAIGYRDQQTYVNLWRNAIPTLNEYSQTLTPAYEYFRTRLLMVTTPDSEHMKGLLSSDRQFIIQRLNPRALQAVGTRFLLSTDDPSSLSKTYGDLDAVWRGQFTGKLPRVPDRIWNVYELPNANHGHFNPTVVRVATTAPATIDAMRRPDFDWYHEAYLTEPLGKTLGPARSVRLIVGRGAVQVQAETDGTALLVLPLQYSHCLSLEGAPYAQLIRADFLLTGLVFTGQINATINFDYGFFNAACRKRDFRDMEAMEVSAEKDAMPPERAQHPFAITSLRMVPEKIGETIRRLKFLSPLR